MRNFIRVTLSSALLTGAILLAAQSFDLHQFQEGLGSFGAGHLSVVIGAIMVSSLFASLRVRSIAAGLGYQMSVRDSIAVLSLGQLGGAIFFQIFGQLAARGSYLAKHNVPFSGTVIITGQERVAAALRLVRPRGDRCALSLSPSDIRSRRRWPRSDPYCDHCRFALSPSNGWEGSRIRPAACAARC